MARRRLWAVALAGVVLVACGSGGPPTPPEAPPPGDPAAPTPQETPPAPADPATPTDPAAPTAPTDPPTPADPPAPPTRPPPPPPAAPAACAGLVPDAPGPGVHYTRPEPLDVAECEEPITDGHGEWIGVGVALHWWYYDFVSASTPGEPVGTLAVPRSQYGGPTIAPQPDGYHAVRAKELPGQFLRYDARGTLLSDDGAYRKWTIRGVPGGGSVLVEVEVPFGVPGDWKYKLVWMSADGARRAEAPMPAPPLFVVSSDGNVLALADKRTRWYDRDGAPMTDWFSLSDVDAVWWADWVVLYDGVALADGSVVVGLGDDHTRWFEPRVPRASSPPEWVTSRAGAEIATVRGGRANAFATVKPTPPDVCEVEIELLTPAGERCGATTLRAPGPCDRVSFGADRTVFTTGHAVTRQPDGTSSGACVWHWWTGLLR